MINSLQPVSINVFNVGRTGEASAYLSKLSNAPQPSTNSLVMNHPKKSPVQRSFYSMEQTYKNGCGAACLLTIAYALGVKKIPVLPGSRSEKSNLDKLTLNIRCEADIYRITSDSKSSKEAVLEQAGYSMPHNIVKAAKLMGLNAELYENPSFFSSALNWIYPNEKAKLEMGNIDIKKSAATLEKNQYEMKALAGTVLGMPVALHWVVALPNGTFMDPKNGKIVGNFKELQSNAGKDVLDGKAGALGAFLENRAISYTDTGISIMFSN